MGARRWLWERRNDARTLAQFARLLENWPSVWLGKQTGNALPTLRFRNGLTLQHGPYDDPLLLLDEVFIQRLYDFKTEAPNDAILVDIGANIGSVLEFFALANPTLRVLAYEPNPAAFEMLRRNIEDNRMSDRVTAFEQAVGRAPGVLALWVDVPTVLSTAYLEVWPTPGGRRVGVPAIGFDEVWRQLNGAPIWLLKIDTEGAEGDILEGASPSSLAAVQNAIVEYHDNIVPGVSQRCYRVLKESGFRWHTHVHPWDEGIIYASRERGLT